MLLRPTSDNPFTLFFLTRLLSVRSKYMMLFAEAE
jgi:hypothetical protein